MPWVESDVAENLPPATGGRWVESDEAPALPGTGAKKKAPPDVPGLTDRAIVQAIPQALFGLPALAADAYDSLDNLIRMGTNAGLRGSNSALGTKFGQFPAIQPFRATGAMAQGGEWAADKLGLPKPEGEMQSGLVKIGTAILGALGGAGAAKTLGGALDDIPMLGKLLSSLGEAPKLQAAGAGLSTLGQDIAEKKGVADPLALAAIGAVAGAGHTPFTSGAGRIGGGLTQLAKPFTQGGREVIVGKALNRVSTTPGQSAERLLGAEEIVPGSLPTVSQVSQDAGLMGAESALRGMDERNLIGNRAAQQNMERQRYLYSVAGDEDTVTRAKAFQKAAYDELAAPAFAKKQPIPMGREWINNPVKREIQRIRETPDGARKTVRDALDEAEAQLTQEGVDLSDAEVLYAIRKDLALARDGKLVGKGKSGAELSNLKTARSQLNDVIGSLDEQIERGAPGFKDYLKVFHERSIPLDQLKAAQKLRQRSETAIMSRVGDEEAPVLGTRFGKIFRDNLDEGMNLRGKGPKAGNLNPEQLNVISRVAADIDRGAAAQASTVRVPGSDTFKNMSVASVIGRILGDETGALVSDTNAAKSLYRPVSFLYRMPDQAIQQLMIEAWLDPKMAGRLMKKATQHEVDSIANELKQRAGRQAMGAALYTNQE